MLQLDDPEAIGDPARAPFTTIPAGCHGSAVAPAGRTSSNRRSTTCATARRRRSPILRRISSGRGAKAGCWTTSRPVRNELFFCVFEPGLSDIDRRQFARWVSGVTPRSPFRPSPSRQRNSVPDGCQQLRRAAGVGVRRLLDHRVRQRAPSCSGVPTPWATSTFTPLRGTLADVVGDHAQRSRMRNAGLGLDAGVEASGIVGADPRQGRCCRNKGRDRHDTARAWPAQQLRASIRWIACLRATRGLAENTRVLFSLRRRNLQRSDGGGHLVVASGEVDVDVLHFAGRQQLLMTTTSSLFIRLARLRQPPAAGAPQAWA